MRRRGGGAGWGGGWIEPVIPEPNALALNNSVLAGISFGPSAGFAISHNLGSFQTCSFRNGSVMSYA